MGIRNEQERVEMVTMLAIMIGLRLNEIDNMVQDAEKENFDIYNFFYQRYGDKIEDWESKNGELTIDRFSEYQSLLT